MLDGSGFHLKEWCLSMRKEGAVAGPPSPCAVRQFFYIAPPLTVVTSRGSLHGRASRLTEFTRSVSSRTCRIVSTSIIRSHGANRMADTAPGVGRQRATAFWHRSASWSVCAVFLRRNRAGGSCVRPCQRCSGLSSNSRTWSERHRGLSRVTASKDRPSNSTASLSGEASLNQNRPAESSPN